MSYKPVVVALRRDPDIELEKQLDGILRPFMYDPALPWGQGSRCDEWSVGGRWAGHFLSVHRGSPDLVNRLAFPPGAVLSTHIACDGGPKGLLDLDFLRTRAEEEVWRRWPVRFHEREDDILSGRDRPDVDPGKFHAATAALVSQNRGCTLVGAALVTLEGEWIEGRGPWPESEVCYGRIDRYIEALDDDVWLVCLSVHF